MPFTFAHPAFILPLAKSRYLSTTALVIGSMAPDFEYFIRMRLERIHGHTFLGAIYFDLPLTLLLCWLFHRFARDAMIKNLPMILEEKYKVFYKMNWMINFKGRIFPILVSALIGIFSHFLMDALTHDGSWITNNLVVFNEKISILGYENLLSRWLQITFSILGLGVIVLTVLFVPVNQINWRQFYNKMVYYMAVFGVMILVTLARNLIFGFEIIATSIAGLLIGFIVVPVFFRR